MSITVADSIPTQGIDFGYCGVGQVATKSFTMSNPNSSLVKYEILTENCPFEIYPSRGILQGKQKQEITIKFSPEEAQVVIATAVFKFLEGEEGNKVLKISAIGKYPFLTINQERIDFETLLVGKVSQKEIMLKNQSLVPAQFTVEKVNDDGKDVAFSIDYYQGTIPPNASFKITVKYVPSIVGMTSCTSYRIKTVGGNELGFSCLGHATGYNVSLSVKSVHFGEVQLGSNTNRLLNIVNDSDLPTSFQFIADSKNVFSFSKLEGIVNAKSSTRIIITFNPQQTVNYYERIFCIVKNHSILYVDLIGTCYDILTKPVPLMQRHVDIYRHKVIMGIHNKPKKIDMLDTDKLGNSTSFDDEVEVDLEIPIDDPNQVVLHKEMFLEMSSENRDLKLREEFLDFAFTDCGRISEAKTVTIDNKYPFEVQISWVLLQVESKITGQLVDNPFKITPPQATIPSNSSFQFNVKFAPYEPDSYFFQVAQCFALLMNGSQNKTKKMAMGTTAMKTIGQKSVAGKTLLSSMKKTKFEEALNEEIDPPTCLNLRLVGHSFPPGSQPFIPMVKISPSNKVTFPAAGVNESVYQSIQIVNTSDTPVYYKVLQDSTRTFRAFPQVGIIAGKSFSLVCFEFQPKQPRFYNFTAQCVFNHSASNLQSIHLSGHCYSPSLTLGNNGKLFFPPSFIGVSSKQKLSIKNDARIPVEFEWKVPEKYRAEVNFDPPRAYLLPNEETKVLTTFTPLKKKEYIVNIPVYAINVYDHIKNMIGFYNPGSGAMQNATKNSLATKSMKDGNYSTVRYDLEIIGAGSDGIISISPKDLDFGTITVGFSKTLSVQVINKSNSNLYIELKMAQKTDEESPTRKQELPQMTKILEECFKFDNPKGLINAKSKKKVNITFKPTLRFDFDIHLVCIAREKPSKELQTLKTQTQQQEVIVEKSYTKIHAMGDFPLLRFTDVRNDNVSTANLWERFHLTNLNKELLTPLNDSEIEFNNSDKTNQSMNDLQKNLRIFTWDFGKVPIKYGSKPRKITLTLKNIGGVRSDWCFKMPNDSEIELEPWADPGEPSDEQAFERHILENKIFHIEPRKGALDPGQQMDLSVYYYPKEVKFHYLKVFFSIQNGKPLILNFTGQTLHRRAQLQLLKDVYNLPPVPIGLEWAVTYPIEIKNLGITKLKYQIDTTALEQLNQNNYDFRVFEIQNPEGTLMANETQYIYTLFRPLEVKDYSLDLPIKISDIEGPSPDTYTLKIRGIGYHFEDKKQAELPFYEDLPKCRANLNENGSMAAFSTEDVDFGELEKGQLSRRFVILYNLHPTQKLKFEFYKSGLMCGDNIKLEPMQGELKPNSHQNIKMTLVSARFPTHFEGEIQCQIEWESGDDPNKQDLKSIHTNTAINDAQEFLFLRLKKRSKITKMQIGVENREGESLVENILLEAMHDILEGDELNKLLDDCEKKPASLYGPCIENGNPPSCDELSTQFDYVKTQYVNQNSEPYEEELKKLSGQDDKELFRKRMFLDKPFVDLLEFMLEDTIFNLMEEATYEEFDLTQAPKIYIRKDDAKLQAKQE